MSKTYTAKPSEVTRQWYIVDASTAPLGRLATVIATHLTGKHKAIYTANIDTGDGVIVINAAKLKLTGNKLEQKKYYRHSGHPGSLKETTAGEILAKDPVKIVVEAVRGMLPKNKLQAERLKRLKVYVDDKHEHEAQKPTELGVSNGR